MSIFAFKINPEQDGSGYKPEYDEGDDFIYSIQMADRKRMMIALADLDYIIIRATHDSNIVNTVGYCK